MENAEETFSWSRFYAHRKEIRRAYPSVYGLKIRKKILDVVNEVLHQGDHILDVGASNKTLGDKIKKKVPHVTYKTMDIDKAQEHDYYSLDEIDDRFNIIILSEVIEHLEFNDGIIMLKKLLGLLKREGRIILSTPNLFHPNRYWDSDHKTPYRYDEISGALLSVGFRIENIYRIYNDQFLRRLFRIYVGSHLHKYLDVDFAKSIIVVADKP